MLGTSIDDCEGVEGWVLEKLSFCSRFGFDGGMNGGMKYYPGF